MKHKTNLVIILLLVFCSGCQKGEVKTYSWKFSDCGENWALCLLYPEEENKMYSLKEPIKVAVLDSGVNTDLSVFKDMNVESYSAIDGENPDIDDFGHGTAIAGLISYPYYLNRDKGVNIKLLNVKVLNDKGGGKVEDIVKGIEWSIKQDADIINMSFGFQKDNPKLKSAIDLAIENNITIISSAGNNIGLSTDYPAAYKDVISISSINKDMKRDNLTSKGKVDFVSPGVNLAVFKPDGTKDVASGTSLATALATGIVANLMTREQFERPEEVKQYLTKNAIPLGEKKAENSYGLGLIRYDK
ncbi:Subtilase family protein [Terribacillus aidingensis]|uniref:Subtilase family protein n=1 Tax=Terribacillus aidingensis TaxID=586416 RepID=A0A285P7E5_9BACI|nr:S8 family serine peptidase [Terribacillus aidingensis]SNZ16056.1 Subtilase family protein [Terribacillus aidingensis]